MAIIKHRKFSRKVFLKELFVEYKKMEVAQGKIDKLQKEYADRYCEIKVGAVLPLPPGIREGYNAFTVQKITVDVTKSGKAVYNFQFIYDGLYTGDAVEPFKGKLKFNPVEKGNENKEGQEHSGTNG